VKEIEADNSPFGLSKKDLTVGLSGLLSEGEFIKEWEITPNGRELIVWIYKKEQK
jgi:hypothetical protein